MKVCFLLPFHWGAAKGGAEYQAHVLAEYLAQETAHDVFYLARHTPADTLSYPYTVLQIKTPRGLGSLKLGMWPDLFPILSTLRALKPDVIIQHVACAYTGIAALYANRHGARFVWYLASDMDVDSSPNVGVLGPAQHIDRRFFAFGIKHAEKVVAQTQNQSEMLESNWRRRATHVIGNFHPYPIATIHKPEVFTLIWVASIKPLKQPQYFLQLAKDLEVEYPQIRFVMVGRMGNGDWGKEIETRILSQRNLEYVGEVDIDEVNKRIAAAHLLVNTSEYEGFPNTFIQAWMHEVPTLSLHVDPDNTMLRFKIGFRCGTYESLRETVDHLFNNQQEVAEMGAKAKEYALKNFSMSNAAAFANLLVEP